MTRRNALLLACAFSLLGSVGCAHTRVVKKQPGKGGEIMVQEGLIGDARADAAKHMRANCGGKKYRIVEEGEAVVGSRTSADTRKEKKYEMTSSRTEDEREWRIKYKCGGRA